MTNCKTIRDNICAYIDDELDIKQRNDFEKHINNCAECKKDLEEMLKIVELCNDLPQKELPSDFKDELHEKLIAVARRQEINVLTIKKSRKFRFNKTISSIAAGVLLIFIASSFYKMGLLTPNMSQESSSKSTMESVRQDGMSENGQSISAAAVSNDTAAEDAGYPERSFSSQKAADEGNYEIDRSATIQERITALSGAEHMRILETATNKLSTVVITANEPEALKEKVQAFALGNSGEIKDSEEEFFGGTGTYSSKAMTSSSTTAIDNSGKVSSLTSLYLIIPEIQYENFIDDINSTFGEANVQTGAFVTEDMTEHFNYCIERSNELDEQIKKLQKEESNENSSRIDALVKEKETLDLQIEQIRLGSDYVNVTVVINKK